MEEDGVLVSAERLPDARLAAAALVARDFELKQDWLNAEPTGLLEIGGLPEGFSDRVITCDYGPALRVAFASRLDRVHLKLYAATDRFEPRDMADLRLLQPTADELQAAARWTRMHNAPGPFHDAVTRAVGSVRTTSARTPTPTLRALTAIARWLQRPGVEELSDYLRASEARTLMAAIAPDLRYAGRASSHRPSHGAEYLDRLRAAGAECRGARSRAAVAPPWSPHVSAPRRPPAPAPRRSTRSARAC